MFKMDNPQRPTIKHMELCSMLCGNLNGRGVWGKIDTCIYVWLSLFSVRLKLSQHCLLTGYACVLSCVLLFATLWTVTCPAPLSMGFSRQEYWSGLPFPPPGDLPDPGFEPASPTFAGRYFTAEPLGKP